MTSEILQTDASRDTIFNGSVTLFQPARGKGYRTNVDALLLADFAGKRRAKVACDLGAGVGAVGLALWAHERVKTITLVEVDAKAAVLAEKNVAANRAKAASVVRSDVVAYAKSNPGSFDLVVANPPYVQPGKGRAPHSSKRLARTGELEPFVKAARLLLARRGRFCIVYPAHAFAELTHALRQSGLEPKRARFVHAGANTVARVVLIEAVAAKPGGLIVEVPLIEREKNAYTTELSAILRGSVGPAKSI